MEQLNRCGADPAVLFSPAEVIAELRRWSVIVPTRKPEEPEPLYAHRLRLVSDIIMTGIYLEPGQPAGPVNVSGTTSGL